MAENVVLCGANSYVEKYYFNEEFSKLPEQVKEELQIMCVMFTEDVGGVLTLEFTPEGELQFKVACDETDYLFDEIGSALKIKQYQMEKRELLEALEADCAVRPSAFDASFSREQLAAFVLDSLLGQMSRGADNCEGLEQVLRRLLYR